MQEERELLKVDDVTLQYKTPQHLVTATYRVGFSGLSEGERYVILGPSGAASQPLLKAVGGFMSPGDRRASRSTESRSPHRAPIE